MNAPASSSSPWPTPQTFDAGNANTPEGWFARQARNPNMSGSSQPTALSVVAQMWPMPDAFVSNDGEQPETFLARREREKAKGQNGNGMGTPLAMEVKFWPSPQACDHKGVDRQEVDRGNPRPLNEVVAMWSTPAVADVQGGRKARSGARSDEMLLNGQAVQVAMWSTPQTANRKSGRAMTASEENGRRSGGGQSSPPGLEQMAEITVGVLPPEMVGINLPEATQALVAMWRTPRSHEVGDYQYNHGRKTHPTPTLTGQASSLQAPATGQDGSASSEKRPTLNPLFVEWLMGWPPAWTAFACSETALSLWRQRMRSALSSIVMPSAAPPAQLALFG